MNGPLDTGMPMILALSIETSLLFLLIGLAMLLGSLGGRAFHRLRIPKVVGYMAVGLFVGQMTPFEFSAGALEQLKPVNFFALALIGFKIGGELKGEIFAKHGKRFLAILFGEALGAFVLVSLAVSLVTYLITQDEQIAIPVGLLLGAIAAGTGPTTTVDVLWENRSRGILTTTVVSVVALDVGLAMILFAVANSVAGGVLGNSTGGAWHAIELLFRELMGAIALGYAVGMILYLILKRHQEHGAMLATVIGSILLVIGASLALEVDLILASMALGATLVNKSPGRSKRAFETVDRFVPPFYILFFVLVGARLDLSYFSEVGPVAVTYVVFRIAGKMAGAYLGARLSRAPSQVRNNLGLCLISQAGIAVGLAILATHSSAIPSDVGQKVLMVITTSTLFVQLIGPPLVKWAVLRAGEVGLNVTEEDLIESYRVRDVMFSPDMAIRQEARLSEILARFSKSEYLTYPVVDPEGRLVGALDIDQLKMTFGADGLDFLLVAYDIMSPVDEKITADAPLQEALRRMKEGQIDHLPVVATRTDDTIVGFLELRAVNRAISRELLQRQRSAST